MSSHHFTFIKVSRVSIRVRVSDKISWCEVSEIAHVIKICTAIWAIYDVSRIHPITTGHQWVMDDVSWCHIVYVCLCNIFRCLVFLYAFSIYSCNTAQLKCGWCGECHVKQNGYGGTTVSHSHLTPDPQFIT